MSRRPSDETWRQVNASATVQAGLLARAQKVAARARDITAAAGGKAKITVDYGIRPGGRARVNVVSDSPEEEYGNETTPKTRAIGRAAREGR